MEVEFTLGPMVINMTGSGKMDINMEKGYRYQRMARPVMESGKIVKGFNESKLL